MADENKTAVIAAIWENPQRLFGTEFRQNGNSAQGNIRANDLYKERGAINLKLKNGNSGITVFSNHGNDEAPKGYYDIFTYAERFVLHTAGFKETLHKLAELYNIKIEYNEETARKINRATLAREVCPCLIESLRKNPTGAAAKYITETRGLSIDAHFGELTADSLKRAKEHLHNRGISYTVEDFKALGLTEERARNGYNVVIPYYNNGNVIGFILRNTTNPPNAPKYLYSQDMGRVGYCDRLKIGKPMFVVEGQMDAIRLIQAYATDADAPNVLAMGGAKISDDIAALLKRHNIDVITYVPDVEYNEQGERKTDIINAAIQAFQGVKVEDEPVIKTLFVSELETPQGANLNGYKIDADTYGKENGNDVLACSVEGNAIDWYAWELKQLEQWETTADSWDGWNIENRFRDRFRNIYKRADVWERQPIRDYIKNRAIYAKYGVTPQALDEVDVWNKGHEYNNRIKAAYTEMGKAIEDGANPVVVADIINRFVEAQATNSADDWDTQYNMTYAEELAVIAAQPDTIKTKWDLGVINKKTGHFRKTESIEYAPADVTVFCASTSHGKTMILFQSALDLVRNSNKTYLYISGEENKRQLLERAHNVYISIPTTESGRTPNGGYCFYNKTRRKTIMNVIADKPAPEAYVDENGEMFVSEHYKALQGEVKRQIQEYGRNIYPRLKLIHTDAGIDGICHNIKRTVTDLREKGVEVGAVFVDYMQILHTDTNHFSRHDELKEICGKLHNCAGEVEIPIVVAAQLNREGFKAGIDGISTASIGEGADIERIARDVFFIWQIDKTSLGMYVKNAANNEIITETDNTIVPDTTKIGIRANRILTKAEKSLKPDEPKTRTLKTGYLYVEHLKSRYGETGGWGLLPYDGESGQISENDKAKMAE